MEQSLDFVVPALLDIDLKANHETVEDCRVTILQAGYASELVTSAVLMDVVTQDQRHEVDLKDALGLRG